MFEANSEVISSAPGSKDDLGQTVNCSKQHDMDFNPTHRLLCMPLPSTLIYSGWNIRTSKNRAALNHSPCGVKSAASPRENLLILVGRAGLDWGRTTEMTLKKNKTPVPGCGTNNLERPQRTDGIAFLATHCGSSHPEFVNVTF